MLKFSTSALLVSEYEAPEVKSTGEGEMEIFKIDGTSRVPINAETYGHFFASHTYIITHTYHPRGAIRHMVIVWQGATCSRNEAGSATLLIKDVVRHLSKTAETTQEVVQQQRMSLSFLSLFSSRERKLVVHSGEEDAVKPAVAMFHIHGYVAATVHAEQITPQACWLNSRDVFVIVGDGSAFLWIGTGANSSVLVPNAHAISKRITQFYAVPPHTVVEEGEETDQFWELLGGKQPYANMAYLGNPDNKFVPRLFAISNTGTILRADEVYEFGQVELTPSKVAFLDTGEDVFVWTGAKSPEKEKKRGMEIALEYVGLLSRSPDSVFFVEQAKEPLSFSAHFHPWVPFTLPPALVKGVSAGLMTSSPSAVASTSAAQMLEKYLKKFPYAILKQKNTPPEVDRAVLEKYLAEDEFAQIFKMSIEEFNALPSWKKIELKKVAELF